MADPEPGHRLGPLGDEARLVQPPQGVRAVGHDLDPVAAQHPVGEDVRSPGSSEGRHGRGGGHEGGLEAAAEAVNARRDAGAVPRLPIRDDVAEVRRQAPQLDAEALQHLPRVLEGAVELVDLVMGDVEPEDHEPGGDPAGAAPHQATMVPVDREAAVESAREEHETVTASWRALDLPVRAHAHRGDVLGRPRVPDSLELVEVPQEDARHGPVDDERGAGAHGGELEGARERVGQRGQERPVARLDAEPEHPGLARQALDAGAQHGAAVGEHRGFGKHVDLGRPRDGGPDDAGLRGGRRGAVAGALGPGKALPQRLAPGRRAAPARLGGLEHRSRAPDEPGVVEGQRAHHHGRPLLRGPVRRRRSRGGQGQGGQDASGCRVAPETPDGRGPGRHRRRLLEEALLGAVMDDPHPVAPQPGVDERMGAGARPEVGDGPGRGQHPGRHPTAEPVEAGGPHRAGGVLPRRHEGRGVRAHGPEVEAEIAQEHAGALDGRVRRLGPGDWQADDHQPGPEREGLPPRQPPGVSHGRVAVVEPAAEDHQRGVPLAEVPLRRVDLGCRRDLDGPIPVRSPEPPRLLDGFQIGEKLARHLAVHGERRPGLHGGEEQRERPGIRPGREERGVPGLDIEPQLTARQTFDEGAQAQPALMLDGWLRMDPDYRAVRLGRRRGARIQSPLTILHAGAGGQ